MSSGDLSAEQEQTQQTFSYKWSKTSTYTSPAVKAEWKRWLLEKYFDGDPLGPELFLESPKPLRVLDAGCGAGMSALLLFGDLLNGHHYVGVDISDSVEVARLNFESEGVRGTFVRGDIANLDPSLGLFDIIFSEGVLHHTDSVMGTLRSLRSRLTTEGRLAFYVYARKPPIREFVDDHIRHALAGLSDEEAWAALLPLTRLGKALGELNVSLTVDEDVPLLGITAGTYDLQRFVYYNMFKAYYRPEYSLEEMNHGNFDWYRPHNCFRHSPEEVRLMCEEARLEILRLHAEESGITVIAKPMT